MQEHTAPETPHATADDQALTQLCAHFGIATIYHDVWGEAHPVAPEDLAALLLDFGIELDAERPAPRWLKDVQREAAQTPMPPVLAIRAGDAAWRIAVRLSVGLPVDAVPRRWWLQLEDGSRCEGNIDRPATPEAPDGHPGAKMHDDALPASSTLVIPRPLPPGYHRFGVHGLAGETLVIAAPATCHLPPSGHEGRKPWGVAVQLYGVRSSRNWGIGDFSDLTRLGRLLARLGADLIGLNPMHALFPHNPAHASPYSPSSRQMLNVLYIDPEAVAHFNDCGQARERVHAPAFQARLQALRDAELVDLPAVAALKLEVLGLLFHHFATEHLAADSTQAEAYRSFVAGHGDALRQHAIFEAVHAQRQADGGTSTAEDMLALRQADPTAQQQLAQWAEAHDDLVQFYQYLQWTAHTQLQSAARACRAAGMSIGLYLDLAVSIDRGGSDAWREKDSFATTAGIGAPPDAFNPNGQNWGLLPPRPDRLRASGYRYFIDTLRTNMRGAGAIRIDHVMGLMRLYWIPGGRGPAHGAYVHYAAEELLAIVALESRRERCIVVGEDLGTVDESMRAALTRYGVLSYRLFYFEQDEDARFKAPADYPASALVAISTHDLATLSGWWRGEDLKTRWRLGLYPAPEVFEQQIRDRARERVELLLALQREGLVTHDEIADAASAGDLPDRVRSAAHAYLGRTPSALMLAQMEDLLGVIEQPNMPGTTTEQPNWRRKLPIDLTALEADTNFASMAEVIAESRGFAR
ncbi:MAG: Malto-oligosyltrehalose synthase [Rhodoferax sp.]|nr:Malto-oligosyltrehalose synthase [Rhodoferax sp.]